MRQHLIRHRFLLLNKCHRRVTGGFDRLYELGARYTWYRQFSRRIDFSHEYVIGLIEGMGKVFDTIPGAGIPMRLKEHDQSPFPTLFSGRQRCFDFRGVMAVVVDDHDAADFAAEMESPLNAG